MATSEVTYLLDADTAFNSAASTLTATGAVGGAVALDKLVNVRPSEQTNKLGAQGYKVIIAASVLKISAGDESYTFNLSASGASKANPIVVGTVVATAATASGSKAASTGQYVIEVDAATIEKITADANRTELHLDLVAAGTAPSVTVAASWVYLGS